MTTEHQEAQTGLLSYLDDAVKVITVLGAAASILGFSALYLQCKRLDFPLALLSLQESARAGVLPTLVFAAVVLFAYSVYKYYTQTTLALGAAIYLAAAVFILPGLFFGIPWLAYLGLELVAGPHLSPGAAVGISYLLVLGLIALVGLQVRKLIKAGTAASAIAPARTGDSSRDATTGESAKTQIKAHEGRANSELGVKNVLTVVFGMFNWVVLSLFGLRWFSNTLQLHWSLIAGLTNATLWRIAFIVIFVLVAASTSVYLMLRFSDEAEAKRRASIAVAAIATLSFLGFLVFYSTSGYRNLSPALGGGEPELLNLWIKADDAPSDLQLSKSQWKCAKLDRLVRCERVVSQPLGDYLIMLPASGPPLVVRRDSIKAMALAAP